MDYSFRNDLSFARELDAADPLREFRAHFYTVPGQIYMDGNSLGLCSKEAEACVLRALEVWKESGIKLWNVEDGKYFLYPSYLGAMVSRLIGADADEVTVTSSTTQNIHQCLATFYRPEGRRNKILVDDLNFPTDTHAVCSQVALHGLAPQDAVKVVRSADGRFIDEDAVIDAMTDDVALVLLPSALYRSAQLLDMPRLTRAAHERGIFIGWDLCHSIGVVPHDLRAADADFAVWCSYKYLNGGPGTAAGLFINRKHFGRAPGMAGWQGNEKATQFQLHPEHVHSPDADGWLTGTPPILSMAAIEGSLSLTLSAGIERLRAKSLCMTAYMMYLIEERLSDEFAVGCPREERIRGGHVPLEHPEAFRICQALKEQNVIPDYREPNVIRLAPIPLYTSYEDIFRMVEILEDIDKSRGYERFADEHISSRPL